MTQLSSRSATVVRLVALALISWTVFGAHPGLGGSGRGLVASLSFGVAVSAWVIWMTRAVIGTGPLQSEGPPPFELYAMATAGAVLTAAAPSSAASAFVFFGVVAAGIRVPLRSAVWVVGAAAVALAVTQILYNGSALGTLAYALGFAAALLAASNAQGSRLRAEQAELLLAQVQRSHEEQMRTTRLQESTRIAREIHDVLAHTLAGLTIQLEATASLVEQGADGEAVLSRIRRAHELAREGLLETRRAVGALRGDPQNGRESIADAIQTLVATYRESAVGPVELTVDGDPQRLSGSAAEAVLRVTQEALTNAQKHAPGAEVSVMLHAGSGEEPVLLVVADRFPDGARPVPGELAASGGGFGLRGMRERAAELGGAVLAGAVDEGWRVELRLPAPQPDAARMERVG